MTTQTELLTTRLAEAEVAYHELLTGTKAQVVVDQNGERVEYTQANRAQLIAYIQRLKEALTPAACPSAGPMRIWM